MKNKVKAAFDKYASKYDEHAILQRKVCDELFSYIKPKLNSDLTILDIGCGTGYLHELFRKNKIYSKILQTDLSYQMCKIAKLYSSSKEYGETYSFVSDAENLPVKKNSVDYAISSLCLQWTDLSRSLNNMQIVLKNEGHIAISTIIDGTFTELKSLSNLNINNFLNIDKIENILTCKGFKNIDIKTSKIIIHHKSLHNLLGSIKNVGANFKGSSNHKYLGKDYFSNLEKRYLDKYSDNDQIPLSWNIAYIIAQK